MFVEGESLGFGNQTPTSLGFGNQTPTSLGFGNQIPTIFFDIFFITSYQARLNSRLTTKVKVIDSVIISANLRAGG
jgi:hypothetical protein